MTHTNEQVEAIIAEVIADGDRRVKEAEARAAATFAAEAAAVGLTPAQHKAELAEVEKAVATARAEAALAAKVKARLDENDVDKAVAEIMARRRW